MVIFEKPLENPEKPRDPEKEKRRVEGEQRGDPIQRPERPGPTREELEEGEAVRPNKDMAALAAMAHPKLAEAGVTLGASSPTGTQLEGEKMKGPQSVGTGSEKTTQHQR